MSPEIRPYQINDRAACHSVFHRAVHEGAAGFYSETQRRAWSPDPAGDEALGKLRDQCCLVAQLQGQIIAFMSLTRSGYIDMAFVLPEAMGKGVATALYDALLSRAKAEEIGHLSVHASHPARRFFLKHGWQVDREEQIERNGERLTRFAMSLCLRQPDTHSTKGTR